MDLQHWLDLEAVACELHMAVPCCQQGIALLGQLRVSSLGDLSRQSVLGWQDPSAHRLAGNPFAGRQDVTDDLSPFDILDQVQTGVVFLPQLIHQRAADLRPGIQVHHTALLSPRRRDTPGNRQQYKAAGRISQQLLDAGPVKALIHLLLGHCFHHGQQIHRLPLAHRRKNQTPGHHLIPGHIQEQFSIQVR